eukprot:TRINITY_DN5224_c0_g3_i7.p1 TRINITY_DN5224_c0_g3~~TRINITY_DN5224_c0_g3_i7.p1  ORF type:complete len:158 (+),score=11.33 TRINITY_DN5224_c0_g3_i7:287-760(+)
MATSSYDDSSASDYTTTSLAASDSRTSDDSSSSSSEELPEELDQTFKSQDAARDAASSFALERGFAVRTRCSPGSSLPAPPAQVKHVIQKSFLDIMSSLHISLNSFSLPFSHRAPSKAENVREYKGDSWSIKRISGVQESFLEYKKNFWSTKKIFGV